MVGMKGMYLLMLDKLVEQIVDSRSHEGFIRHFDP